jgi:spore maturation protein CgeB
MRILYVAMRYDYGQPEQGDSFEHCNFFDSLRNLGHDVLYFDLMTILAERGREAMNRRLHEIAKSERPAVMFTVLFGEELEKETVRRISDLPDTTTVNWFCDDHWRFEKFSQHWAPAFNWIITTDSAAVAKYRAIGYHNVIKSQWACNHFLYRKFDLPLAHDVTFVGQPHGVRRELITALSDFGIRVKLWGQGWGQGRAPQEQMIEIFNQSRINLNFSNSSIGRRRPRWQRGLDQALRLSRKAFRLAPRATAATEMVSTDRFPEQIKGRNFEVPGCGGLLLTGLADNLHEYYEPSREVACYRDFGELVRRVRYYLEREEERAAVAAAGYERTIAQHTYAHRFADIFRQMGVVDESVSKQTKFSYDGRAGRVEMAA